MKTIKEQVYDYLNDLDIRLNLKNIPKDSDVSQQYINDSYNDLIEFVEKLQPLKDFIIRAEAYIRFKKDVEHDMEITQSQLNKLNNIYKQIETPQELKLPCIELKDTLGMPNSLISKYKNYIDIITTQPEQVKQIFEFYLKQKAKKDNEEMQDIVNENL